MAFQLGEIRMKHHKNVQNQNGIVVAPVLKLQNYF